MGIYCRDKTTGPYALIVMWKDAPTDVEEFTTFDDMEIRIKYFEQLPYSERPDWEAADTQGNIIGES